MSGNSKPNLLHIEDSADIYQVVSALLSDLVDITLATSLNDARQNLLEQDFDLVLLDLTLPDGSGLDLLAELKAKNPPMSIIIHSSHDVSETTYNVDAVFAKSHTQLEDLRNMVMTLTGQTAVRTSAQ